jgi:hypothetical protein
MISTLHWIPKGVAKAEPDQYELTPEDIERLQQKFASQLRVVSVCGVTPRAAKSVKLQAVVPIRGALCVYVSFSCHT